MSEKSIRAKLPGLRALSTIVFTLALVRPAGAQVFGALLYHTGNSLWLSAGRGNTRGASMSDEQGVGTWNLGPSKPLRGALDWGRSDRSVGLAVSRLEIPLRFDDPSCPGCRGQVQALVAMGTYRRAGSLFGSRVLQIAEFGVGLTRWNHLTTRVGRALEWKVPDDDLTYSIALGVGFPLGDRFEMSIVYDVTQVLHSQQVSGVYHLTQVLDPQQQQSVTNSSSNRFLGLNMLRAGVRIRLGKQAIPAYE